jgi:hypothetical protein
MQADYQRSYPRGSPHQRIEAGLAFVGQVADGDQVLSWRTAA